MVLALLSLVLVQALPLLLLLLPRSIASTPSLESDLAELTHIETLVHELSTRRRLLIDRLGLPNPDLESFESHFHPYIEFDSGQPDLVSGDVLLAHGHAHHSVRLAVVASPRRIQIFDERELKLDIDVEGFELAHVRAASGPSPLLVAHSRTGHVSVHPLIIQVTKEGVTVAIRSPPVSMDHKATSVDIYMQKTLPRLVLGTADAVLVLDERGNTVSRLNTSSPVTHVAAGHASQVIVALTPGLLLTPLQLAFATADASLHFGAVFSQRAYGSACSLAGLGAVRALVYDGSRSAKHVFASMHTGELLVFDRLAKEPARVSTNSQGVRALLPAPARTVCALVRRLQGVNAAHLSLLGAGVLLAAPNVTLRSAQPPFARKSTSALWSFVRAAVDTKLDVNWPNALSVLVFNVSTGRGAVLLPLAGLLVEERQAGQQAGLSEWFQDVLGPRGPVVLAVLVLGVVSMSTRGGGLLFGAPPTGNAFH